MSDANIRYLLRDVSGVHDALPDPVVLRDLLDVGGQGIVYRGSVGGVDAAIKVYFPGQILTRIEREIEALGRLDRPSIVKLLWSGDVVIAGASLPVVATRFVAGVSLHERLQQGPLTPQMVGIVGYDTADAIEAMWEQRIVHRDLKPKNLMLTDGGRCCVIDLGVARHLDEASLTAAGATWGTLGYLSPEQTKAVRQLTCKSDLFALGVILLQCITGTHPTRGDQAQLQASVTQGTVAAGLAAGAPHQALISSLLSEKPFSRPDPKDVKEALASSAPHN